MQRALRKDHTRRYRRMTWDGVPRAVITRFRDPKSGEYTHPEQDRTITIREAARLQGFPDWFVFHGDRADAMLAGLRDRVRQGNAVPEPAWRDAEGQQIIALARRDPKSRTVSLILDATTASITMFAVSAYAGDREAHIREVEQYGQKLPEDSYGTHNRQAIAARETRVAARLRAVERAYRTAIEHDAAVKPEPVRTIQPPNHVAEHEMELEPG
jgi:hypothetical protein